MRGQEAKSGDLRQHRSISRITMSCVMTVLTPNSALLSCSLGSTAITSNLRDGVTFISILAIGHTGQWGIR
mgnify:CR=1 FL=1